MSTALQSTETKKPDFKKSLKRPDAFLAALRKFFSSITGHARGISILVGGFVLVVAAVSGWMHVTNEKHRASLADYYVAVRTLQSERQALAPPAKADPKKGSDKNEASKELPAPASADEILFKKLDVDASFLKSLGELKTVVEKHPGTMGSFQALMAIGGLYLDHGSSEKAIEWFEKASKQAPGGESKAAAGVSKAVAFENLDRYKEAQDAYESALNQGRTLLRAEAMIGLARVQAAQGQSPAAIAQLDKVIKEYKDTAYARQAEQLKQSLEKAR